MAPRADYEHWNEEATMVWWEEEGKHEVTQSTNEDIKQSVYDSWYEQEVE